jgi:hypothetical protein
MRAALKRLVLQYLHIENAVDVIQQVNVGQPWCRWNILRAVIKEVLSFEERCCTRLVPKLERLLLQSRVHHICWHGAGGETD